jgi:hypothetical protein
MAEVMARKDRIVMVSAKELQPDKPTLMLFHGATDDPSEMMDIGQEWSGSYNVLLYSYNFHSSIGKIARDFVAEMRALRGSTQASARATLFNNMTVVSYSYGAVVFRKAVLLNRDESLFSGASLIQLVPTAGGSFLARGMGNFFAASLVSLASKSSAAENPYGHLAEELWDGEGNRKFYQIIDPKRTYTLLVEADSHSLAAVPDAGVRQRYQNGIGSNVIVIPKELGVTHENFPTHPVGLEYVRKILGTISVDANPLERTPVHAGSLLFKAVTSGQKESFVPAEEPTPQSTIQAHGPCSAQPGSIRVVIESW